MNRNDQQFMAQKIRTQYMEKQPSELDALRELDAKVKRPAGVFAYVFGSISAIIMGAGMSLVMTEIGDTLGMSDPLVPGVIIGAVLMGVINLGMSLMGVDQNWQKVVKGVVLLAAVIFDVVSKRGGKLMANN